MKSFCFITEMVLPVSLSLMVIMMEKMMTVVGYSTIAVVVNCAYINPNFY